AGARTRNMAGPPLRSREQGSGPGLVGPGPHSFQSGRGSSPSGGRRKSSKSCEDLQDLEDLEVLEVLEVLADSQDLAGRRCQAAGSLSIAARGPIHQGPPLPSGRLDVLPSRLRMAFALVKSPKLKPSALAAVRASLSGWTNSPR